MYLSEIIEHSRELLLFGALFALVERLRPAKRLSLLNRDLRLDLLFSLLTAFCWPIFAALSTVIAGTAVQYLGLAEPLLSDRNLVLQFVAAIVAVDLAGYWRHRLLHTRLLWPVHEIHHSSTKLTWASLERFHPINSAITMSVNACVIAVFVNPEVGFASLAVRRFYGQFIHCNLDLSYGALDKLFVSPHVHHWHHSRASHAYDKNFATFFSLFDWIFGTLFLPTRKSFPKSTGLQHDLQPALITQLLHPFMAWSHALRRVRKNSLQVEQ